LKRIFKVISFSIFLIIIGFAGVKQISAVNSMVVELYDSKLVPIVYLQNIKSDMEYIRSTDNKLMDATDDDSKKPIQEDIQTHIASMKEKLAKFENESDYKELLNDFEKFVIANVQSIIENIQDISSQIEEIGEASENHAYGSNQLEKAIGSMLPLQVR
jgi:methyl-accepting chemotaxis protein